MQVMFLAEYKTELVNWSQIVKTMVGSLDLILQARGSYLSEGFKWRKSMLDSSFKIQVC